MNEHLTRTEMLLGAEALDKLRSCTVAVFGIGGVGGYAVEALARSGIGGLVLVDHDTISLSNLNRQLHATLDTVGRYKVDVAAERIAQIDPAIRVQTHRLFFTPETGDRLDFSAFDYVIDAIDTVTGKLLLVQKAMEAGVPILSSMGTGNKLDPTAFEVTDINKTSGCHLARIIRKELRKRGIPKLKVVYSKEEPATPSQPAEELAVAVGRRQIPGSVSFVPSVAGLIAAGEVIKDLLKG